MKTLNAMKALKQFSFVAALLAVGVPAGAQDKMIPVPPSGSVTLTLEEYNRLVELGIEFGQGHCRLPDPGVFLAEPPSRGKNPGPAGVADHLV